METDEAARLFRFGVFEADARTGELRKQGRRLSLQGQPLQVLLMLLARRGELVAPRKFSSDSGPTAPSDFDHSLNTAINKIREALGDSASNPRFVETLARRGYRFIAPVEVMAGPSNAVGEANPLLSPQALPSSPQALPLPPQAKPEQPPAVPAELSQGLLTRSDELPQASRPLVRSLFLLLQVMYLCFYAVSLARLNVVEDTIRSMVPHTLWAVVLLIITALIGIPTRLYLISAAGFNAPGLRGRFLRIFPVTFVLDELWALAPFLLAGQIGYGLAMGATAALLYAPFAQRSLILMGAGATGNPGGP